jgi:hypothetical protein
MSIKVFDFDDTLLYTDTKIYLEILINNKWQNKKVSTKEFIDYYPTKFNIGLARFKKNNINIGLSNFYKKNVLYNDAVKAIKYNNFAPAWNIFINTIVNCDKFFILTSRGTDYYEIKKIIIYIINNVLTDEQINKFNFNLKLKYSNNINLYFSNCDFIGTDSDYFRKKYYNVDLKFDNMKCYVIDFLLRHYNNIEIYDDSKENVDSISKITNNHINKDIKIFKI